MKLGLDLVDGLRVKMDLVLILRISVSLVVNCCIYDASCVILLTKRNRNLKKIAGRFAPSSPANVGAIPLAKVTSICERPNLKQSLRVQTI